ncbi:MAG: hypothetical protein ABIH68_02690 [bacterium]
MFKKIVFSVAVLFIYFSLNLVSQSIAREGNHYGERQMLDVDIQFSGSAGTTITNAAGIFYHYYGRVLKENKIYPPEYWGEYPLYFFGTRVPITVTVRNSGPRAKAKIRVRTECNCLLTDGSNGVALMSPLVIDAEVGKGETKTIDSSFVCGYVAGAESGLDRFTVKVMHMNSGGGPGNEEPALIMSKEGVFCPPDSAD